MGHSSLLGLEHAAIEPEGRDIAALGPGDNSDSGSDRMGLEDLDTDDPVERHPAQRGVDVPGAGARDIGVDRIFTPGGATDDAQSSGRLRNDEDPDLTFIDSATAADATDEEDPEDEDGEGQGLVDEGDNVPGAHAAPPRMPPGQNPAPDGPQNPGLPGDGDGGDGDDDVPVDDDPDGGAGRPVRTAGSPSARPARSRAA
jgi:hypothetical protein